MKIKSAYNFKDLTGKSFGRLTVIRRVQNDKHGKAHWLCKCTCGNEKVIAGTNIGKDTWSCGCFHKEQISKIQFQNLKNKKFTRLKVISRSKNIGRDVVWKCKCDCGNLCEVRSRALVHNRTRSCGCLHRDTIRKEPYYHLFTALNRSAKNREQECSISFDDFLSYTKIKKCHYCNGEIEWWPHQIGRGHHYNLDRMDNKEGYTLENCVVCCPRCNQMKGTLPYLEFYEFTEPVRYSKQ